MRASVAAALLLGTCGCAGQAAPAQVAEVQRRHLAFVRDGVTTREQVLLTLGVPSAQFEGERILTYRLGMGPKGEPFGPMNRTHASEDSRYGVWWWPTYNLVLVFDARNVLERHSFIEVR